MAISSAKISTRHPSSRRNTSALKPGGSGGGLPAAWTKTLWATQWNVISNTRDTQTRRGYGSRFSGRVGSNPLKEIRLSFTAAFLNSSSTGLMSDLGNDMPIQKCSIEYNGVTYPVTFSGLRSRRVLSAEAHVHADPISVQTAFGVPSLAIDEEIWVKWDGLLDSTTHYMPMCAPRSTSHRTGQQVFFYRPAADGGLATISDTDLPGMYTFTGGTNGVDYVARAAGYTPAILGVHTMQSDAWVYDGDSITAGTGDSGTNTSGIGYACRMSGAFAKKMASGNVAVHGSTARAGYLDPRFLQFYDYSTLGLINKGTNDFGTTGVSSSVLTVQSNVQTKRDDMKARGVRSVVICGLVPRTESTDSWVTEENQTLMTGFDPTFPLAYNAQLSTLGFEGVVPFDSIRGTTDPLKWRAPPKRAFDTTHPAPAGAIDMMTEALPVCQPLILY